MSQQQQDVNQGGQKVTGDIQQANKQAQIGVDMQDDAKANKDNQHQNNQMINEQHNKQQQKQLPEQQQPKRQIDPEEYASDYQREDQIARHVDENEHKEQQQQSPSKQQQSNIQAEHVVVVVKQQQQLQQPQREQRGVVPLHDSLTIVATQSKQMLIIDNSAIINRQLQQQQKRHVTANQPTQPQKQHSLTVATTQYDKLLLKLRKYLIIAYYSYVVDHHASTNTIFSKYQIFKRPQLDITIFLKFYKDFHLKDIYKVNEIIKTFKTHAINRLWIDASLLIKVILQVVENKCEDNSIQAMPVSDQSQRLERLMRVVRMFDREKVKMYLKSRQLWQEILGLYRQRDDDRKTVERQHYQNRSRVVGEFLERNFSKEVPKWLEKKDKQPTTITIPQLKVVKKSTTNKSKINIKKVLTEQSPSPIIIHNDDASKKRDEKAISNSIERLRTQSEKSIINLKKLISNDFSLEKDMKQLITKKSSTLDKPKNKSKIHKTPSSVAKQIEDFLILENSKVLKSQDTILMRDLNLKDDQPYLRQYFQNEIGGNKNNYHLSQKRNERKHNNISVQNVSKNIKDNININPNPNRNSQLIPQPSYPNLPKITPSYIQQSITPIINRRKQPALSLNIYQQPRRYGNVQSQPSHRQQKVKRRNGEKEQKRSQSMKKLSEEVGRKKEVIEKNVYEYMVRNKEKLLVVNAGGSNKQVKLSLDRREAYNQQAHPPVMRLQKSISTQIKKTLLSNQLPPPQPINQRKQVYHMWRNFI